MKYSDYKYFAKQQGKAVWKIWMDIHLTDIIFRLTFGHPPNKLDRIIWKIEKLIRKAI